MQGRDIMKNREYTLIMYEQKVNRNLETKYNEKYV